MASIKISALGELELDRLSDADVFIINDQDATTQKITFETLKNGLDRDNRSFGGRVEFTGEVLVTGNAAGTNVYTKDGVHDYVASQVDPIKLDVTALQDRSSDLETLVGATEQAGSILTYYPIGSFTNNSLKLATYTVKSALERVGTVLDGEAAKIIANNDAINLNSTAISTNTTDIATLRGEVDALNAAVFGVAGNDNLITDNSNNIQTNVDNIGALANVVGVAVGATAISVGTITNGFVEAAGVDYTVIAALGALDTAAVAVTAKADANETAIGVSATNTSNVRDHSIATRTAINTACTNFKAGNTGSADDLADAIIAALAGVVDPIYTNP